MPWWAIWQKDLFCLIPQQHKLCWISSAMRPKPHLPLLLLSFCCESHGGEDEKKRREKKSSDSTWSLQWRPPLGRGRPQARSSFSWHHPCLGSARPHAAVAGGSYPVAQPASPAYVGPPWSQLLLPARASQSGQAQILCWNRRPLCRAACHEWQAATAAPGPHAAHGANAAKHGGLGMLILCWADCAASAQLWKTPQLAKKRARHTIYA